MSPLDLVARAAQQARDLGHPWIGSEHLLLALLATDSASGQALRACGLSYEAVCEAVSGLSDSSYVQGRPRDDDPCPSTLPATGWSTLRTFSVSTRGRRGWQQVWAAQKLETSTHLPRTLVNKEVRSPRLLLPINLHEQHPRLE
jgi:ATP-dependent Clp protease ATP-binding subunit ClpA